MVETIISSIVFGVFILLAYTLGLKNGQKIINKDPVELPKLNPSEIIKQKKIKKEQQAEIDKLTTIFENIDNYDGTGANQREV